MRIVLAIVLLAASVAAHAGTRNWVQVSGGVVSDAEAWSATDPAKAVPPGDGWIETTGVSPLPQAGWNATENGNVWSYTPSIEQLAQAALSGGLTITSNSTPTLNGTYAIDPATQAKIMATSQYIAINGTFYGGATSYPWLDSFGMLHVFPTVVEFQAFASAIATWVSQVDTVIAMNAGAVPAQPISIQ
jgi:hypothetical protein